MDGSSSGVRLAELVASLSLATDLGLGQPEEHVLRQTVIATRLARAAGLPDEAVAATFFVSLLALVGCVADSHELARWFGDDTAIRAASYEVDRAGLPMLRFLIGHLAAGGSSLERISLVGRFLGGGVQDVSRSMAGHCQTTADIADRLGLPEEVRRALPQALERWDGRGGPRGLRGSEIEPVMRIVHVANEAEVFHRVGGIGSATTMLRERRGSELDPELVDRCVAAADGVFRSLGTIDTWRAVIDGCRPLDRELTRVELREALATFADYADLKSPWFLGHSRAVAALAADAAGRAGLPSRDVVLVELAGFVCRIGAIGVSSATWDRPASLTPMEWERVRTVPYLTERVLGRQARLREVATLAGMVHERLDGSGYPRGLTGGAIPLGARVLAAAQVYQALREARPHRPPRSAVEAERILRADAGAGRLDAAAVEAVLLAAGHRTRRRPSMVDGLTAREVEVLALLVRGASNKDIAAALSIAPRTVSSHVEHIYTKIGVSTRGAAAMYAMRHGLVDAGDSDGLPQAPGPEDQAARKIG